MILVCFHALSAENSDGRPAQRAENAEMAIAQVMAQVADAGVEEDAGAGGAMVATAVPDELYSTTAPVAGLTVAVRFAKPLPLVVGTTTAEDVPAVAAGTTLATCFPDELYSRVMPVWEFQVAVILS